jgi:hypothetical protein
MSKTVDWDAPVTEVLILLYLDSAKLYASPLIPPRG